MKSLTIFAALFILILSINSCNKKDKSDETNIVFLHHSTGLAIWGVENSIATSIAFRLNKLYNFIGRKADLPIMFKQYNEAHQTKYRIEKKPYPTARPYGWFNGPYQYYNTWVKNAGDQAYKKQPTLELLTKDYDVIIFKHCFPVSNIQEDQEVADIDSHHKSIANYKLQYQALKKKIHEFPDTRFILFTGAVQVRSQITEDEAIRAREFFSWVREEWDTPGDNIYLWDLYSLETEGNLYFKDEYAASPNDSHPGEEFSARASKLLFQRIIDVIENDGLNTTLTGG